VAAPAALDLAKEIQNVIAASFRLIDPHVVGGPGQDDSSAVRKEAHELFDVLILQPRL